MTGYTVDREPEEVNHGSNLGHLRLRHVDTNDIILIPTPTNDPNDPLNWSRRRRVGLALLVCLATFFCNFLAASPSVAIVQITIDYEGVLPTDPTFLSHLSRVAYLFTSFSLTVGLCNLFWMPLIVKYGKRPVYIVAFTLYTFTALWAGLATSYASALAARIMLGIFAGAGECVAPLSISDLFFLHERGFFMALYTCCLAAGVSIGIVIAGLITIDHSWRYIYYVAVALIGALTLAVVFLLPETTYNRNAQAENSGHLSTRARLETSKQSEVSEIEASSKTSEQSIQEPPRKETYVQSLRIFRGVFTTESLWKMTYRPVILLLLPPVLWATLVMSVTIGFLVAVSANFASAFATFYGFKSWQSGLCFISGFIGSMAGILGGGWFSDWIADFFTRRNGGIREPEMRLPAITLALISSPLGLVLYGCGFERGWHWMVPTLGLGLLSFAIAQGTNVSFTYIVDAYRPIAGEAVVTQLAFKAAFGFLLSFYTNPWIQESGYANSFGTMAGISGGIIILWIPMYIWGARIRHASLKWAVIKNFIQWDESREVGGE